MTSESASTPAKTAPSLLTETTIFEIDPVDIDCSNRIGFLHEDKAAALGRLMAVDGQRDPIKVTKSRGRSFKDGAGAPWRLVTGMHRTHGAALEGIKVWAIEVSGQPEDLADLEASENLHRRPLSPIERAKFTAALVGAARERLAREHGNLSQQQMAVKARWNRVKLGETRTEQALTEEVDDTCATIARVYGWEESAVDALGMSRSAIHRDLALYRLIVEPFEAALVEALARHPIVGDNAKQLKDVAGVRDEAQRRAVIEMLLADPELSADQARVRAGIDIPAGATPLPYQKFYNQIEGGWSRLNLGQKRAFIPQIASMVDTPDLKRALRDKLNDELGDRVTIDPASETAALRDAFKLLTDLSVGDPVDDDDLFAAQRKLQRVLFGVVDAEATNAR